MAISRKKAALVGGIAAVAAAIALVYALTRPDNPALRVRLTWTHQAQFAGVYLAEDKGYYRDEGVAVEVRPGGIEYSSVKMVAAGTDDVGLTSADQILIARARGVPLVALAALYQRSPVVLFSLRERGITRPEHLRGRKIGIKYGDNTEVPIRALLAKAGLRPGDYEEVSVSYDVAPLLDGRVDVLPGFALNEPISLAEHGHAVNTIYAADHGVNFYADVIFAREDVLRDKRAAVEAFVRATLRGYEYAMAHVDEAVAATRRRAPEARADHERAMVEVSTHLWRPEPGGQLGQMEMTTWEAIQDILVTTRLRDAAPLLPARVDLHKVVVLDLAR
jgi:ABC-type nitrate/sulfonate/bicarbonate transport system substrate-binding protein